METVISFQELINNALSGINPETTRPDYNPTELELIRAGQAMIDNKYLPYDQETFKKLAVWFARYNAGKKHGLLLSGFPGTGKTHFMKTCIYMKVLVNASSFVRVFKKHEGVCDNGFWYDTIGVFDSETWKTNIIIDDLGQEPTGTHFGLVTEVLEEVLNQRYLDWQKNRALTLITSNLCADRLNKRYGTRTYDRLREMCDLIEFNGGSLRGI